jgi:hypothetical protein
MATIILFEPLLGELMDHAGRTLPVPHDVLEQADEGDAIDAISAWARKAGLIGTQEDVAVFQPAA